MTTGEESSPHVRNSEQIKTLFRLLDEIKDENKLKDQAYQKQFSEIWENLEQLEDALTRTEYMVKDAVREMGDEIKATIRESEQARKDNEYALLKKAYDDIIQSKEETRKLIFKTIITTVITTTIPQLILYVFAFMSSPK